MQTLFTQDFYLKHLSTVSSIHFTKREIDIISCIVNARKTSKIAFLLDINPRTVEVHVRNIMAKLKCNSRETIIDFLEASSKLPFLKEYYSLLRGESAFEKSLKDIAKLNQGKNCFNLSLQDESDKSLAYHLRSHLELAGFEFSNTSRKNVDYLIFILSKKLTEEEILSLRQKIKKHSGKTLFLLQEKESIPEIFREFNNLEAINFLQNENYHFSFFIMLKKLLPNLHLDKIIADFKDKYEKIDIAPSLPKMEPQGKNLKNKYANKRISISFLLVAIILGSIFLILIRNPATNKDAIQSGLDLSREPVLLNRPELISQIDEKLKKQSGIQVVALVGAGGAGKTTIARQYAYQQKLDYIWEINAETKENLRVSFEKLAKDLAKTNESQQMLKEIEAINDAMQKEESVINFVKSHLKEKQKWLLIYDNVETFKAIQKYFPCDFETWGPGRVIITTRDSNIDNNKYVNHIVDVGELSADQKITLFRKIIKDNDLHPITNDKMEGIRKFLDHIPSFPLDVSIAAFYLKATQTSPATYLENIAKQDNDFTNLQKDLLTNTGDYTKTRYGIITLSLEHLIKTHKEFKDLLLLISLLDSQNIPKELLIHFKNNVSVDQFIFNLKKYSLLSQSSDTALSIHRSTQAISLMYFTRKLNLEKNKELLGKISENLIDYMDKVIKQEDMLKMQGLISSCEAFLNHPKLLNNDIEGIIKGELGVIYYFIGDNLIAKTLLENSILKLNNFYEIHPMRIAFFLGYLGNVFRDLGDYHQGKLFLKRSISIYKKHYSSDPRRYAYFLVYLSVIERYLGNYNSAKDLLENAIVIHKQHFPENKNYSAWVFSQLGAVERMMRNYEKAQKLLEESLLAFKQDKAPNHDITSVLAHLAAVYIELGEHKKATDVLEECLRLYASDFPDQVGDLWILSYLNLQDAAWQYEKANDSFKKILEKYKDHFHGQYIYVVEPLRLLGNLCGKLGNYEKAKTLLAQLLLIYQRNYGDAHIKTAQVLSDLSVIYLLDGHLEISERSAHKALTIFEKNKHPDKHACLETLSKIYQEKFKVAADKRNEQHTEESKAQSIFYLNQALEALKENFGEGSLHEKKIMANLKELEEEPVP